MQDREIYNKILKSLDILNKSQAIQEQNTVVLFTHLYNIIKDQGLKIEKIEKDNNDLVKKISSLENKLKSIDNRKPIKEWFKNIYDKCYKFIFKKKLERERLERERLEKERKEQEEARRKAENKKKIKEILNTTKRKK